MNTAYDFVEDLASLRILLSRETQFVNGYNSPSLENHIRPLVITLDNWLSKDARVRNSETRRATRLAMLSYILQRPIRSTYDVSLYQCTTITHFIWHGINGSSGAYEEGQEGYPQGLSERAKRFLSDLQSACKTSSY
jgi:hypothetical protein